jgi:glutaminyl-peptide cyclotransferase
VPATKPHDLCRDWLKAELAKSCDTAVLQPFTHTWSRTQKPVPMDNIIGEINWKDAETRIALFAHWDTRPTADQEPDPERRKKAIAGANDGASGVAVLLELARVLKANPLDKKIGIRFVLVDGEDLGPGLDEMFLGAAHYARSPGPRGDYGILLDMIGDKDLRVPVEPNSLEKAGALTRAIFAHAKVIGLSGTFPNVIGPEILDDHIPLNAAGLPTVDLIDFDYPYWHTLEDTPDKCSAESLGKVGRLLETWLRKNPTWKP